MYMNKITLSSVCLILLVVLSGCTGPQGIIRYDGDIQISEGRFFLNGEIQDQSFQSNTYKKVTVYLYANSTLLKKNEVGELNRSVNVSMTSETVPRYIVISSPDFWGPLTNVDVAYYERLEGEDFTAHAIGKRSELPVQPKN